MRIAEQASTLVDIIERRDVLHAHVEQLDGFQARREKLGALVAALVPLSHATLALRKRNIAPLDMGDRLPGVLSQARRIRQVFEGERDAFIDARRSGFPDFERTVSSFSNELEREVRQAWRTHTERQARPLNPEVIGVLRSVPAYMDSVRLLSDLAHEIAQLREALPTEDVCKRFDEKVEKRRAVWEEMGGGDFSPEILRFLRGASTGGVPLDDLTPAVEAWMQSHRLRGSFRITMSPSRS